MEKAHKRIQKFVEDRDWDQFHTPANLVKSIIIEAGELMECFQWNEDEYDLQAVKEELADVMIYCIQMADKMNIDMEEIILEKMRINERKYPVEKAKGNAKKYNEL